MNQHTRGRYVTRETILDLLSDDETAKVSNAESAPLSRACPATATARGVLRRIDGYSSLRGEAWDPIADEWQIEERLELDGDGLCARSVGGGESRDESAFTRRGTRAPRTTTARRGRAPARARRPAPARGGV